MRHAAIVINGILRDPVTGAPNEHGRDLYHALANNYRITLLADAVVPAATLDWLLVEGFHKHMRVVPQHDVSRLSQIQSLRAEGPLDLVVTPEADLAEPLFEIGQASLIYINPRNFGLSASIPSWDDLTKQIDRSRAQAVAALLVDTEDP